MPRRGNVPKRETTPDAVYGSVLVTELVNSIMLDGKKSLSEAIVYQSLETVGEKMGKEPVEVLDQALKNIMPVLEVKPRRVGGATYQVPVEVRPERRVSLGLRWLVRYARARGEKTMAERLAGELMDAANGTGSAVRRREETHRMAEANKAFAHYRW
jgi:small subunit ribosomal protein S7